jgi:hypothetical protein
MLEETSRKLTTGCSSLRWVPSPGSPLGLVAQLLRQIDAPLMSLGAATAPWLTIGFILSLWASPATTRVMTSALVGVVTIATYLFAWLASYHTLFAIRESVTGAEAWREAAPWAIAAIPTSLTLGLVAASHRGWLLLAVSRWRFPSHWHFPSSSPT